MSDLAKAELGTVLNVADNTTEAVSVAVRETADAIAADTAGHEALAELENLRQAYLGHARKIADAVGDAL